MRVPRENGGGGGGGTKRGGCWRGRGRPRDSERAGERLGDLEREGGDPERDRGPREILEREGGETHRERGRPRETGGDPER